MTRSYKIISAVLAAICLICGLVLLFNSGAASEMIFRTLGIIALVSGAMRLVDEFLAARSVGGMRRPILVRGAVELVVAIVLIFFTGAVLNFISFVVGICLLAAFGFMIYQAVNSAVVGTPGWWVFLVISVAGAIFALVMTFGGINAVSLVLRVAGLALTLYGGGTLWTMYKDGTIFR